MKLGEPIRKVEGRGVVVPGDDLDTDRIIPARFLRCVTFDGLGQHLFADERIDPTTGAPTGHPLDDPGAAGARVLISGMNFGCGSSREHAPQSIQRAGFDAVIAGSFAEIFLGNATTLGLVCVTMAPSDLAEISAMVSEEPSTNVHMDVERRVVEAGGRSWPVELPDGLHASLVSGRWDPLQLLRERQAAADTAVARMPYTTGFAG